jgi:putative Mg2+ transporter-C (MgtC) family protein
MDWAQELLMATRAIIAALLGACIGYEREHHGQDAGLRTYAAVCLGSCIFGLVSTHALGTPDTRIAANVVVGIGFLGVGVIFRNVEGRTAGLTTAATLWATAAVGLGMAFGMYVLSILTAIIVYGLLALHHLPFYQRIRKQVSQGGSELESE